MLDTKVLLIDDEVELASTLTERLRLRGYDATSVSNSEEAIKIIRTNPPDVILLDFRMPGMDGLETLTIIKQIAPSIEIIMLTGLEDSKSIEESKKYGVQEYIIKPADIYELINKIDQAKIRSSKNLEAK